MNDNFYEQLLNNPLFNTVWQYTVSDTTGDSMEPTMTNTTKMNEPIDNTIGRDFYELLQNDLLKSSAIKPAITKNIFGKNTLSFSDIIEAYKRMKEIELEESLIGPQPPDLDEAFRLNRLTLLQDDAGMPIYPAASVTAEVEHMKNYLEEYYKNSVKVYSKGLLDIIVAQKKEIDRLRKEIKELKEGE